jgi:superfamily II DNA/RNA helicase
VTVLRIMCQPVSYSILMISEPTNSQILANLAIPSFNDMQLRFFDKAEEKGNLMLIAPTGTGKTLAFLVPLLRKLSPDVTGVQALIITPSRELALQIEQVFRALKSRYKVSCFYGGHSMKLEQRSLNEAAAVLIGTPGRLADHFFRGSIDIRNINTVVLDEFDQSLQLGFHGQLRVIFSVLGGTQRHLLTSATKLDVWPDFLPFSEPETVNCLATMIKSKLRLKVVNTKSAEKVETLMRLVAGLDQEPALVFCNHRDAVERISALLTQHQFDHGMFHGGMEQIDRERSLIKFRGGAHNVLLSTDLASRGLDIPEVKHVVHYQLPPNEEAFIHRNGRTARMSAEGQAYLVVANDEGVPSYINEDLEEYVISEVLRLPPPPSAVCLYISGGKRDKISKADILGLFTSKGGLAGEDIGLITVLDFASYVSVKRTCLSTVLATLKNEKLKKARVKIEVAY